MEHLSQSQPEKPVPTAGSEEKALPKLVEKEAALQSIDILIERARNEGTVAGDEEAAGLKFARKMIDRHGPERAYKNIVDMQEEGRLGDLMLNPDIAEKLLRVLKGES